MSTRLLNIWELIVYNPVMSNEMATQEAQDKQSHYRPSNLKKPKTWKRRRGYDRAYYWSYRDKILARKKAWYATHRKRNIAPEWAKTDEQKIRAIKRKQMEGVQ